MSKKKINTSDMVFGEDDIEQIKISVTIGDKRYTLKEANEGMAAQWMNQQMAYSRKLEEDKMTKEDGMLNLRSLLVSYCLFDEKMNPVPINRIKTLKREVVTALYERAREISGMDRDVESCIINAFEDESATPPCTLDQLREWAKNLDDDKHHQFKVLLVDLREEDRKESKNSQGDTTLKSVSPESSDSSQKSTSSDAPTDGTKSSSNG